MRAPRVVPVAAALVLAPALLAACGSSGSTTATTASRATTTTASASTGSTAPSATTVGGAPAVYQVRTGKVSGLGTVLVDGQGMTLYLFVPDKQSGTSTCYSTCAEGWPPLLLPDGVTSPVSGPGAQAGLLGTTHRTDGTTEVTYNKWPLYTWVGDSEPGQATGQALDNDGGLWYVVSPNGHAVTTRP